ncbi:MAG: FAD-binding protein, partial [Deinococcus sp.]|nr:FAD-binding protein [Deinococcus sp.]
TGFEPAATVPGTIGGAVVGNAGCYGWEIQDNVEQVRILDYSGPQPVVRSLGLGQLEYRYRESVLKRLAAAVLTATLWFRRGEPQAIATRIADCKARRAAAQPLGNRSAGSFFKNVTPPPAALEQHPELRQAVDQRGLIAAGYLLDRAGCKGMRFGGAEISEKHANFVITTGSATSTDIIQLAWQMRAKVLERFHIALEAEVRFIGFPTHPLL